MPRPKRRFLQMKMPATASPKPQCCVVCYSDFTPFTTTSDKWESNMIKMFYNVLDIPSMGSSGEDGDEDDSVISLPFCPQCHSKISVMSSLRTQLESIQVQFCTVRDDVAFTIVDTIDKNCRNGPMDFIRQQIYDKWKSKFEDAKGKGDMDTPQGLERLALDLPTGSLVVEQFRQHNATPTTSFNTAPTSELLQIKASSPNINHSTSNGDLIPSSTPVEQQQAQQQPSKRPARAASLGYSQYLLYSQTTSLAKIRKMEAIAIRESINHEMPKLTAMDSFQTMGQPQQRISQKGKGGAAANIKTKPVPQKLNVGKTPNPKTQKNKAVTNVPVEGTDIETSTHKRRGSVGKRGSPLEIDNSPPVTGKLPKVQTTKSILKGLKLEEPVKIKLKVGRKPKYQPEIVANNSIDVITQNVNDASVIDSGANGVLPTNSQRIKKEIRIRKTVTPFSTLIGIGDFPCQLCPKVYFNISRLRRHESLCHPSTKSLVCAICPNGFSSMLAYRRHMQNQHHRSLKGVVTKTCPFCKKSFVKQTAYDYHVRKHHDRKIKRGRKPRGQNMNLKMEGIEEVDPLLISFEDAHNMTLEDFDQEMHLAADLPISETVMIEPTIPVTKKVKKSTKIFMGGRKRKRRRTTAISAKKGKTGVLDAEIMDPLREVGVSNTVIKQSLNASGTEFSEAILNMKAESLPQRTPKRVGFKSRFTTPTPPVRKSLRRAEAIAIKAEILDIDQASNSSNGDDKTVYNCSVCSMNFPFVDLLNLHMLSHIQNDHCNECDESFVTPEELSEHILKVHPHSVSLPSSSTALELSASIITEYEPDPIEINLEDLESAPDSENNKSNPLPETTKNEPTTSVVGVNIKETFPAPEEIISIPSTTESKLNETTHNNVIPTNTSTPSTEDTNPEKGISLFQENPPDTEKMLCPDVNLGLEMDTTIQDVSETAPSSDSVETPAHTPNGTTTPPEQTPSCATLAVDTVSA